MLLFIVFGGMQSLLNAKDFDNRKEIHNKSIERGLGVPSIEMLERLPGPGAKQVANSLVAKFSKIDKKCPISISVEDKNLFMQEKDRVKVFDKDLRWKMKVWADGTKLSFRNHTYIEDKNYKTIPLKKRFTNEELESKGRRFIEEYLKGVVKLQPNEEIVPLWTEFEIEGGVSETGQLADERIASSTINFGRRVDGIDVVGPGSKISINFANDGEVVAFYADWPVYKKSTEYQEVLPLDEILERLSAYGKMSKNVDYTELRRFECGYYDPGAQRYDPYSMIQAGCQAITIGKKEFLEDDGSRSVQDDPIVNIIPAGIDPI